MTEHSTNTSYIAAFRAVNDKSDPLSTFNLDDYHTSLAINTTSPLLAAQHAIQGFKTLDASASKTFIFTGNILNLKVLPGMLTFGMTKEATAYWIRSATETSEYAKEGIT